MSVSHSLVVPTSDDMRALGARLGAASERGDVIVLVGELGAGKTTIAQGIGRGLGIVDQITSPTFVIARAHANPGAGPDLVHVDAYRLGSIAEVDDLELDADLQSSVVVVEWGEGLVDSLSDSPLVVRIQRSVVADEEVRVVDLTFDAERWEWAIDDWSPQ